MEAFRESVISIEFSVYLLSPDNAQVQVAGKNNRFSRFKQDNPYFCYPLTIDTGMYFTTGWRIAKEAVI